MSSQKRFNQLVVSFFNKKEPAKIFYCSLIILPLLYILPVSKGYELTFAFLPITYGLVGLLLAGIYWSLKKLIKKELSLLFYLFFFGLVLAQLITALDMAYELF